MTAIYTRATSQAELRVESTIESQQDTSSHGEDVPGGDLPAVYDYVIARKAQSTASLFASLSRRCLGSIEPGLFSFEKLLGTFPLALEIRGEFSGSLQAFKGFHELLKFPYVFYQNFEFHPVNRDGLATLWILHGVFSSNGLRVCELRLETLPPKENKRNPFRPPPWTGSFDSKKERRNGRHTGCAIAVHEHRGTCAALTGPASPHRGSVPTVADRATIVSGHSRI